MCQVGAAHKCLKFHPAPKELTFSFGLHGTPTYVVYIHANVHIHSNSK